MGETTDDEMAEASEVERDDEVLRILSCFKLNPFEFLNLPFDSSLEDVENQFRKLSLLVHPDNCKHPQAKEAFGALAKAQQLLMDPQERDYILSQVKEAKEELLFQHKNQLKIDTASKPMSLVDETFKSKYEQSEEFQHQLRLKVKELLKQEEWSRTMAKQVHVREPRPRKEEEEEKEMRKRKREHEEQWEGTREKREIVGAKKSPLLLRMILLVAVMMCGIYICSVGLKQISSGNTSLLSSVQVSIKPCTMPFIDESEKHLFHFPKPSTYSRGECACNPVRYFAILSTQRSGSGWFETLLNSHRNVSSNGEIFSVKVRRSNVTTIIETLDKVYNLDWLSSASKNECTAAVGLKWMLNQGLMKNHQEIVKYFTSRGVSVIFLFRRNLLRRMVSILANTYDRDVKLLNGTHKSHVHSPLEAEILANYKPKVNATKLIGDLKQVDDMVKKALEYFDSTRHMLVYYEDVLKNRTKLLDVQDFLKIPRMKLTSRQVKIHKGPLSEQVANWDEVLKTLNGTQYESFIRSDYKV